MNHNYDLCALAGISAAVIFLIVVGFALSYFAHIINHHDIEKEEEE